MRIASVFAVLSLVALLGACGDGATPETPSTPTTTPSPTPSGPDEVAVVVDAEGRLVVLDADSGEEERLLFDGLRVDDPADNTVELTPDRRTVFFTRPNQGAVSDLAHIPVTGGDPETLGTGYAPAVSPDGNTLAYVRTEGELPPEPLIVLRDLPTGEERELETREAPSFAYIADLGWTADGGTLSFTAGEIRTGLYLVGRDADSLDDARRLGPELDGEDASWGPVATLGTDRLAVIDRCCDVGPAERWRIIAVDLDGAVVEEALLPGDRTEATSIDGTGDGRLLIVADGGPDGGRLLRWDGDDSQPRPLGDDIITAAW